MRLLLDTHVVLWALTAPRRLSAPVRQALADRGNDVAFSVASVWELAVKARLGKLAVDAPAIADAAVDAGFTQLGITAPHLQALAELLFFRDHRDPFDHLLIAQALAEDRSLVSDNRQAARYPARLFPETS